MSIFQMFLTGVVVGMEDDVLVQKRYDQAMSLKGEKDET